MYFQCIYIFFLIPCYSKIATIYKNCTSMMPIALYRKMAAGGSEAQRSERVAQVIRNLATMKENSKSITGELI